MKKSINKLTLNSVRRGLFEVNATEIMSDVSKSDLIYALLAGLPTPMVVVEEKGESMDVLHSGSIIQAIQQFIRGGYKLSATSELKELVKDDIAGMTFFDFSDDLKERFLETEVVITAFRQLADKERKAILSNPFTRMGMSAAEAAEEPAAPKEYTKVDEQLDKYLTHPFFERVNVPNISIDTVLCMMMITPEGVNCNLSSDNILAFKDGMIEVPNIQKELNYLAKAYGEKTVYLKKLHLPMIFICAKAAMADKVTESHFKKIIDSFFDSNNVEYKKASDSGTASKPNVNKRTRIMLDYYNEAK